MKNDQERFSWHLEPHCCRACFGRLLSRETFDRRRIYRCSNCGAEREGSDSRVICCCGLKLRTGRDMGVRCVVNESKSPEFPSEIVAMQVDPEVAAPRKPTAPAPKRRDDETVDLFGDADDYADSDC